MSDLKVNKQRNIDERKWSAALYIRLSREDELKGESNSIVSQREILREFLRLHPDINEYDCYEDDGWTGTNFERPGFIRMMNDIADGKINCVIVKDLSRFGRNYTKGGEIITDYFVRENIRFIACNNFYDSLSSASSAATNCITLGVTNVINESVSATTSVNVRATLNVNRQQGKFIGSFASYGYKKDHRNHHKLIVDDEAATVVRMIFEKFLEGESIMGITKDLNELGFPNPSEYKRLKGLNYKHPTSAADGRLWADSSVRRILKNEMYTGTMIQGKNRNISYKNQHAVAVPESEWFRVEDTHEAIIDKETFGKVQTMFNKGIRKPQKKKNVDLFSGLVRCADCNRIMSKKTNNLPYGTYSYYRCVTNSRMSKTTCSRHSIRIDRLEGAVLVLLQTMIKTAVNYDEVMKQLGNSKSVKNQSSPVKTIEAQKEEKMRYQKMTAELYPDWKSGVITKDEYDLIKLNLLEKIKNAEEMIEKLEKTFSDLEKNSGAENEFLLHFKKYGNIERLTRRMVVELIDEILVYENNEIEIRFKFRDEFAALKEYIEANNGVVQIEHGKKLHCL